MVGVGIVGFGYWGPNYLRILRQFPEVDYLAVCDINAERLKPLNNTKIGLYSDYNKFLQDPQLNALIVATPSPTHYELAKTALNQSKHVLLEKPVTLNSDHARELAELAKEKKLTLLSGHVFLYNDGIEFIKNHITKPEFGNIHEIECIRQSHGPIRTEINVMWDLATHDISILLYLLNQMPTEVSARGFKYRSQSKHEDSVVMTLHFPNETNSTIKVNWQYPLKERRVTVIGSNQMIRFSDTELASPVTIYDKSAGPHGEKSSEKYDEFKMLTRDGGQHSPSIKVREPLMLQIQDFLHCIASSSEPKSNSFFAVNVIKILEAAQESLNKKGVSVEVKNATFN